MALFTSKPYEETMVHQNMYIAQEPIYANRYGQIAPPNHPDQAVLVLGKGQRMTMIEARRWGLVDAHGAATDLQKVYKNYGVTAGPVPKSSGGVVEEEEEKEETKEAPAPRTKVAPKPKNAAMVSPAKK